MSDSIFPIDVSAVYEPRLELGNRRQWIVVRGSEAVTYYAFPAQTASSNQWTFNCNPPSRDTVLDRVVLIEVPYTLTFGPNALNPTANNLLQPGRDAFRAFPISSITQTLSAVINGFPVTIELGPIISSLSRFHVPYSVKNGMMSIAPNMTDNCQTYADFDGANTNPLGSYDINPAQNPRGAYPMTVVSNTPAGAVITGTLVEEVVLPPFLWANSPEAGGLTNMDTLTFNWVLNANLANIWSHSTFTDITVAGTQQSIIGSLNVQFATPNMFLAFLTPSIIQQIPPSITYPYFQVNRYTTQTLQPCAPNASLTNLTTNSMQLESIPRKIYLFAKQADAQIFNSFQSIITHTDTFMQIDNININFANVQGILSGASQSQLYQMSVQNGLNITYPEWLGITQELTGVAGNLTTIRGLTGSIVCIEPAKDFGIRANLAEGSLGQFLFQVQFGVTNTNQHLTFNVDLWVICVYDGILTVASNFASGQIGVVTPNDVVNAPLADVSYHELEKVYGGDFFSTFKNIANRIGRGIRKGVQFAKNDVLPVVEKGVKIGKDLLPIVTALAPLLLAAGEGEGGAMAGDAMGGYTGMGSRRMHRNRSGGVLYGGCKYCGDGECMCKHMRGGAMMSKHEMRKRLMR